jgi:hypothetical protein
MACQPAAEVSIFLAVALDALSHAPVFVRESLEVLHLTVTFLTGDFVVNMALVIEKNVFGYVIDFYPRGGGLSVKIPMLLKDLRVLGNNILVTVQAFFYRRDSGKIRVSHIWMTELTLDLFNRGVHIMTKGDRLPGSDPGFGRQIKEIDKCRCENKSCTGYPCKYGVVFQCSSSTPK